MGFPPKRALTRFATLAFFIGSTAYALQSYLRGTQWMLNSQELGNQGQEIHDTTAENEVGSTTNVTVWEILKNDPTISKFYKLNEPMDIIYKWLDNPKHIFTIYAPIDSAWDNQTFPSEAPDFYWSFLSLHHMASGWTSYADLAASTTMHNRIVLDIFQKYRQRYTVKDKNGDMLFNRKAKYVGKESKAINGYVHRISGLLHLPDAAADALREWPQFRTFRQGLMHSDVAVPVNNTQGHLTQTIFAPSNEAFAKLGHKVNKFLFSAWGRPYLAALLKYHIVMNHTLYSDIYYKRDGKGQVRLDTTSEPLILPTLLGNLNLNTSIVKPGRRQTIQINGEIVVSDPDMAVMDGVLHLIDTVMMPPRAKDATGSEDKADEDKPASSWTDYLPWSSSSAMSVEQLMERLQPYAEL